MGSIKNFALWRRDGGLIEIYKILYAEEISQHGSCCMTTPTKILGIALAIARQSGWNNIIRYHL